MVYEERDGKLSRISDRAGHVWAELAWNGPVLTELRAGTATVHFEDRPHPLLGRAHAISGPGGQPLTEMSAVDWARPGRIPAIAAPGRLPPGVGAVILNVLAVLAVRARVPALRYAGPYPTHALYRALLRSFHTTATEAAFVDDALARAAHLATDELPLEFVPAPHVCLVVPGGHVELRDGLERAVLDGISYEPQGSPARLIDHRAELWFGDAPWAHVATFAPDGSLLGGPHPIPACTSDVIGRAFPGALRTALAELVADAVPAPLAADARAAVVGRPLRWDDLGARAARHDGSGFAVHAALWERIGPLGLARLALAIAEALAPVVVTTLLAELAPAR